MTLSPLSFCKRYISSYKTPSSSASPVSSLTLPIQKRYQGNSEPILDTKTEGDELEAKGNGLESDELEEKGLGLKSEEDASEDKQQQAVPVEDTAMNEPLARQCTKPKSPRISEWFKEKEMLAEALELGLVLDEE
ncbi:hypothetical protein Tco_0768527 [Tanacetum coccineum]